MAYYRNAGTGVVAVFSPEYAPLGRLEFATPETYEAHRVALMEAEPTVYIPPGDMTAVTSLTPAVWGVICGMYATKGT